MRLDNSWPPKLICPREKHLRLWIKKYIEHKKDEKISIESLLQTQTVSVQVIDAIDNDEQVS